MPQNDGGDGDGDGDGGDDDDDDEEAAAVPAEVDAAGLEAWLPLAEGTKTGAEARSEGEREADWLVAWLALAEGTKTGAEARSVEGLGPGAPSGVARAASCFCCATASLCAKRSTRFHLLGLDLRFWRGERPLVRRAKASAVLPASRYCSKQFWESGRLLARHQARKKGRTLRGMVVVLRVAMVGDVYILIYIYVLVV